MKILIILLNFVCMVGMGQITFAPSITMPSNVLPPNISEWNTYQPFMITTTIRGGLPEQVKETKILINIKVDGKPICGKYTPQTAPYLPGQRSYWVFNTPEILSHLGDCTLKAGQYELCVEFFDIKNQSLGSACKPFTVLDTKPENYTPPSIISPADGKILTEAEQKQPINFRWTPIIPKPRERVIYRIIVVEVKKGQSASEARNTGNKVYENKVENQTQLSCCINPVIVWPIAKDSKYAWYVEALDIKGSVLGSSEVAMFSTSNCLPDVKVKLDSANCTSLINGTQANTIFGNVSISTVAGVTINSVIFDSIAEIPTNAAVSMFSMSGTITPTAGSHNFSIGVSNALCKKVIVKYKVNFTCLAGIQNVLCADTLTLPCCICNPCKNKFTRFSKDSTNYKNEGNFNVQNTITHGSQKVIKASVQIVDFERLGENGCLRCTKEGREFGNFIGGSLNGNGSTIATGSYSKLMAWDFNTPTSINNFKYELNMMFPPLTNVSCCKDSIRVCYKWSFVDENCITCDTTICKVYVREYKTPSIIRNNLSRENIYASQIQTMGEPYISWYKQKDAELPKDFNKQAEALYKKIKEEAKGITLESYTEDLKQTFQAIQQMKLTGTDAVWNAIASNPLNTQCGNGNFESGTIADWSGAYLVGSPTTPSFPINDPSTFSSFTNGFNPVGGVNASISVQSNQHSIVGYANDPKIGTLLNTTPSSSNLNSYRLGNAVPSYGSELISKKFNVTGTGIIRFMYASVFNDGGHGLGGNPSFWVKVYDNSGTPILNKVYLEPSTPTTPLDHIVGVSNPTFFKDALGGSVKYRDWTCAKIDLSQYIGQNVSVALITTDCHGGAHWGYTYIDGWCGDCDGASSGTVQIQSIADSCIKTTTKVCVKYSLPKGTSTGSGIIKLKVYKSGVLHTTLTSPTLTTDGTYCFNLNPTILPCTAGIQGYDVVAEATFTIGTTTYSVTSPDPANTDGIKPGRNNDLVCCSTLSEQCCNDFKKTINTTTTVLGSAASGFSAIRFQPTFNVGPKPIKKISISVINLTTSSSNKECLTCEANTNSYGSISVLGSPWGSGKDNIEGMSYPTIPMVATCLGCPPMWNIAQKSHEVIWGSDAGVGYNLSDGIGDQSTTFTVNIPKKLSLACCDDTVKICIKYSFTDIDCRTCESIVCYQFVNRKLVNTFSSANRLGSDSNKPNPAEQSKTVGEPLLSVPTGNPTPRPK